VLALLLTLIIVGTLLALLAAAAKGLRDGDRPLDVTVRAAPARGRHPEGAPRSVLAEVYNPGPVPVLIGLTVRRSRVPAWLSSGLSARVPVRASHRRFRPQAQATVGVLAPGERDGWPVPAPAAGRRGRLTAVIGQDGGRLRVITLTVPLTPGAGASTALETPARPTTTR
jgi:hypothetical protein